MEGTGEERRGVGGEGREKIVAMSQEMMQS